MPLQLEARLAAIARWSNTSKSLCYNLEDGNFRTCGTLIHGIFICRVTSRVAPNSSIGQIQVFLINALCGPSVAFDLSHLSAEQPCPAPRQTEMHAAVDFRAREIQY
jgi:hypothetical protein